MAEADQMQLDSNQLTLDQLLSIEGMVIEKYESEVVGTLISLREKYKIIDLITLQIQTGRQVSFIIKIGEEKYQLKFTTPNLQQAIALRDLIFNQENNTEISFIKEA